MDWSATSPIWNVLSALAGGLVVAVSGWVIEAIRGRRERERELRDAVRPLYRQLHARAVAVEDAATKFAEVKSTRPGTNDAATAFGEYRAASSALNPLLEDVALLGSLRAMEQAGLLVRAEKDLRAASDPVDMECAAEAIHDRVDDLVLALRRDLGSSDLHVKEPLPIRVRRRKRRPQDGG